MLPNQGALYTIGDLWSKQGHFGITGNLQTLSMNGFKGALALLLEHAKDPTSV